MIPLGVLASGRVEATSAPSGLVLDSFDRANTTTGLGTADTGQAWLQQTGSTWGIDAQQAYVASFSSRALTGIDLGSTSMRVAATVYGVGLPRYPLLAAAAMNPSNTYQLVWEPSQGVQLTARINGSNTAIYSGGSVTSGDRLELQVIETGTGATLTVSKNGTVVHSSTFTDPSRPQGTLAGLGLATAGPEIRFDDFEAEAL